VALPPHAQPLVSIETDAELPYTAVSITNKMPHRPELSGRDFRRSLSEQLYHAMLNGRFDEIRRKPGAPFLSASSRTGSFVRTADAFSQQAVVKDDAALPGLEALLEEVARVERFGFTATELERAKRSVIRRLEQQVAQREKTDARERASQIVRHFLRGSAMPAIDVELALAQKLLPGLALEELNGMARAWTASGRRPGHHRQRAGEDEEAHRRGAAGDRPGGAGADPDRLRGRRRQRASPAHPRPRPDRW
jgi:zinc protease